MTELRTIQIGTVRVHDVTPAEADRQILSWLTADGGTARYVCTPNADYVVRAQRDPTFMNAINDADLRVPDGKWIVYASRIAGRPIRATVTGRLLIPRLAAVCRDRGLTMGLMGAGPGVAANAAARLVQAHPGLVIGHAISPPMGFAIGSDADRAIVAEIAADPPAILCVALGAPKQELWMQAHRADLPTTVLVGIGAGLDIVAGRFREAPAWMTRLGFEWMFRLAQEPRRLARRYLVDDPWILWWAIRTRLDRL
jgi:N-acetylglucosaminyldiphosphoundecaprenol N-acetyl-beta-D-mannosaminyltransferase